uniref:Uncharacterized protein n=1 Tax=Arion vulgaris TaxID=1028688 RepID=A0A0B7B5Z7_9EUPU
MLHEEQECAVTGQRLDLICNVFKKLVQCQDEPALNKTMCHLHMVALETDYNVAS